MPCETSRNEYIKKLERSEARLRTILDSEPECVKTVDKNGHLLDMNPAGLAMVEAENLEQVRGANVSDLIDPKYHTQYFESLKQVFQGERSRLVFEIIGLEGTRRWMDQVSVPIHDPDDPEKIIEMLAVTRDITTHVATLNELKLQKRRADEANLAKSQFLAHMSHEIRTPMNGVLGMTEALTMTDLTPKQAEMTNVIIESGAVLMRVINDILDLSKIEAKMVEIETIAFNIDIILNSIMALHGPIAKEQNIDLRVSTCENTRGIFHGDPVRIQQVLENLVSNALKFTPHGTVSINVTADKTADGKETKLHFSVTDEGPGITPEIAAQIFTPFTQGDASTTRKYGGTGLGLAISKQLCDLMGGEISMDSVPGEGSTFQFYVCVEAVSGSLANASQNQSAINNSTLARKTPLRILVAEDNITNQKIIETFLSSLGVDATIAQDGTTAVELWQAEKFDLILMDIQMPNMCGMEAAKKIRLLETHLDRERTPIIAVTANVMTHQITEYMNCGFDDYLAKPLTYSQLSNKINESQSPRANQPQSLTA